jgi:hypothetical protein
MYGLCLEHEFLGAAGHFSQVLQKVFDLSALARLIEQCLVPVCLQLCRAAVSTVQATGGLHICRSLSVASADLPICASYLLLLRRPWL